jgi:hypothetical protein
MYIICWSLASHLSEFRETGCFAEGLVIRMLEENDFVLFGEIHFLLWRMSMTTLETTRTPYSENWNICGLGGNLWYWGYRGTTGSYQDIQTPFCLIFRYFQSSSREECPLMQNGLDIIVFVNRVWMLLGHGWNSFLAKRKIRKRGTQSARVDGPRYNKRGRHPKCSHSEGPDSQPVVGTCLAVCVSALCFFWIMAFVLCACWLVAFLFGWELTLACVFAQCACGSGLCIPRTFFNCYFQGLSQTFFPMRIRTMCISSVYVLAAHISFKIVSCLQKGPWYACSRLWKSILCRDAPQLQHLKRPVHHIAKTETFEGLGEHLWYKGVPQHHRDPIKASRPDCFDTSLFSELDTWKMCFCSKCAAAT